MPVALVYVRLAEEAPVHDEFDLPISEDVQLLHKGVHRLHVGDVPRQLAVVEWQPLFLAEQQEEVDLRQAVRLLVLSVFDLLQRLRVA